jgi:hypothetical protein
MRVFRAKRKWLLSSHTEGFGGTGGSGGSAATGCLEQVSRYELRARNEANSEIYAYLHLAAAKPLCKPPGFLGACTYKKEKSNSKEIGGLFSTPGGGFQTAPKSRGWGITRLIEVIQNLDWIVLYG